MRPRSSVVEHFFGKEEVKGPIPFVGFYSRSLCGSTRAVTFSFSSSNILSAQTVPSSRLLTLQNFTLRHSARSKAW